MESKIKQEGRLEFKVYPDAKSPHLFRNKFLELLTKTRLSVIAVLYLIVSAGLISVYLYYLNGPVSKATGMFIAGIFAWTFAEYILHRFFYHKIKDSSYSEGLQYVFHGIHHEYPSDDDRIMLPPVPGLLMAGLFFGMFYLLMGDVAFAFSPGFLVGYLIYISIHWMVHMKTAPDSRFQYLWRHHTIHHYQQHDRAFGVSSPLWDIIFRTMPEKNRRTIKILTKRQEMNPTQD